MNQDNFNQAIAYIEAHLAEEIDLDKAGQIAGYSGFHFNKLFTYLTDMPLGTYIRNRRMTLASYDLQKTDMKVIDVALKYGYDSPTAFNRAFKKVHGIAPSKINKKNIELKYHEQIHFDIAISGNRQFTYRIESKPEMRIIGTKENYPINLEENFNKIPIQWFKATITGKIKKILSLNHETSKSLLGVSVFDEDGSFDYYIATESKEVAPPSLCVYTIPAMDYAIFKCKGAIPKALQTLQKNIITDWLPSSGYDYADAPDIEVYFEGNRNSDDYECEIWLPVKKS